MKRFSIKRLLSLSGLMLVMPFLHAETRDLEFSDFTGVSAGWGIHLDITQGPDYRVQVIGDSRDLDRLNVEKEGDVLAFSHKSHWGSWRRHGKIQVNIVMPMLNKLELSGGANGQISMDSASEPFTAELSGDAELNGQLRCGDIRISLSGGGELHLVGEGQDVDINGSGGSQCDLREFQAANVRSQLSGGSRAIVNMNGVLEADQSGGSEIIYYGNATLGQVQSSGGSKARKGSQVLER